MSTEVSKNLVNDEARRFGYAIVVRRTMMEMKRRELAERADLSYPYVSEIEKGTKEPSAKSLRQLAEALGFASTAELLAWTEQQHPPTEALVDSDEPPAAVTNTLSSSRLALSSQPPAIKKSPPDRNPNSWSLVRNDLVRMERMGLSRPTEDAIDALVVRMMGQLRDEMRLELSRIVAAEVARQVEQERLRR
jgi:transcriptional regulator with XRE-family HTH domain